MKNKIRKLVSSLLVSALFVGSISSIGSVFADNLSEADITVQESTLPEGSELNQDELPKSDIADQETSEDDSTNLQDTLNEEKFPLYDADRIIREAKEIGVGYADGYSESKSNGSMLFSSIQPQDLRWNKWDERNAGKLVGSFQSGIQIDIVTYNPTVIHDSWKEGVLGFRDNSERAFCSDPSKKFKSGTLVCQPMEELYNYETIQLVCAMLKYIDDQEIYHQHLNENDIYALRQCAVWVVLNTVENWYSRDVYFEFGNGIHCPGDSSCYKSNHVSDLMNNGWTWAHNNYKKMRPKNCFNWYNKNTSTAQPLSTWDYDYVEDYWIEIYKKPSSNGGWVDGKWLDGEAYAKWAIDSNPAYSLEGAKYTAWNEETGKYYYNCITTDKYGYGWCYLPAGRYQIQESVPPKGYQKDDTWHKIDISTGNYTFTHNEPIKTARIRLQKKDENGNVSPDMKGAVYGIWNWEGSVGNGKPDFTITVDENGFGQVWGLPLWQHYYIKEISAPQGYELDTNTYFADLSNSDSTNEVSIDIVSKEPIAKVSIELIKTSENTNITAENPNYSLEGAEYTVYSDEGLNNIVGVIKTDKYGKGTLSGLRAGTYWVKETKASLGFELDSNVHVIEAK